jgi:hypothetical protein
LFPLPEGRCGTGEATEDIEELAVDRAIWDGVPCDRSRGGFLDVFAAVTNDCNRLGDHLTRLDLRLQPPLLLGLQLFKGRERLVVVNVGH